MAEDEFSGEKSVITLEPTAADYEPATRFFRSVAAIGVIYGTLAVVFVPFGLLRFHQGDVVGDYRVGMFDDPVRHVSIQALWMLVSSLTGAGLGLALMLGGIGGVLMKSWSLVVLRLWAVGSILFGLVGCFFFFQWLLPPWRQQVVEVRGVVDSLMNLFGWMYGSCLAITMLIAISRKPVVAALKRDGRIS